MNQTSTLLAKPWSLAKNFIFRFFFILCAVMFVPTLSVILWNKIILWAGVYFFQETVTHHVSGSGDTLYDYYDVAVKAVFALLAAIIWSILDRKRGSYNKLLYWQEVYIRYYLAVFLLVYGFSKVIKLQFSQPSLSSLLIPLGYKSPMGLAWTFIGFSDTYTLFSGLCEVAAACFLVYRKTRTLGALISFGVMLNVFLMNMSYDIPVKLFSLELVLLSAFLIGLDYKRLIGVFILNRPAAPQQSLQPFKKPWANITTQVVKVVAIIAGLGFTIYNNLESKALYGDTAPKPALYGIYEVKDFIINKDTLAPVLTDTVRWRHLVIESGITTVFNMKTTSYDYLKFYNTKTDTVKKEMAFFNYYNDSTQIGKFSYQKTDKNHFTFIGLLNNDSIKINTVRTDEKNFPLMNRGFHWINEYPYNR